MPALIQTKKRSLESMTRIPHTERHWPQIILFSDSIHVLNYLSSLWISLSHHKNTIERYVNVWQKLFESSLIPQEQQPCRISHRDPLGHLLSYFISVLLDFFNLIFNYHSPRRIAPWSFRNRSTTRTTASWCDDKFSLPKMIIHFVQIY